MNTKTMNQRATKLADWLLRIHARYESMNGFTEAASLLHEQQAYIDSLEHQLKKTNPVKQLSDEEIEVIVKAWFNCHPEESLTSEFSMPLYSVVNLCKKLRK